MAVRSGSGPGRWPTNRGGKISYATIDTGGVSSGAPILSPAGKIVGVHTHSGCLPHSGANFGSAIGAIRSASKIL